MSTNSSSGNNSKPHRVLISRRSHVEVLTNAQWALLLCGLTSPAVIDPQGTTNRLGVEDHTTGICSTNVPFEHNAPQAALLALPSLQEHEDPFQLAGQVQDNPTPLHQTSSPYTEPGCSLSTQVPCAPVMDSPTLEGVFNLSLHLDPPVNYVCLRFLSSGIIYQL